MELFLAKKKILRQKLIHRRVRGTVSYLGFSEGWGNRYADRIAPLPP